MAEILSGIDVLWNQELSVRAELIRMALYGLTGTEAIEDVVRDWGESRDELVSRIGLKVYRSESPERALEFMARLSQDPNQEEVSLERKQWWRDSYQRISEKQFYEGRGNV